MHISYGGIGHVSVTFPLEDCIVGEVCKFNEEGYIYTCSEGDAFVGIAESASTYAAAVQIHGFAKVNYTGEMPIPGYVKLCANGRGGVCVNEDGREYLVVEVNDTANTVVIEL